jgi:hypothetical protein
MVSQAVPSQPCLFRTPELSPEELGVLSRIEELRGALRYQVVQTPRRWTGSLRRVMFARVIQGSNTIEGYNVTLADAMAVADGEQPLDAAEETARAVAGYRNAMTYVLQLAGSPHFRYSEGLLNSLHFMMLNYDMTKGPGLLRSGPALVQHEPSGRIVYEGPDADLVPGLMDDLVASLNQPGSTPVMVRAAMAHLNLVMIHPYRDGNGRMARILQSLVLSQDGILAAEFSSIEEYLGKNTQDYYDVLAEVGAGAWHPERDARPDRALPPGATAPPPRPPDRAPLGASRGGGQPAGDPGTGRAGPLRRGPAIPREQPCLPGARRVVGARRRAGPQADGGHGAPGAQGREAGPLLRRDSTTAVVGGGFVGEGAGHRAGRSVCRRGALAIRGPLIRRRPADGLKLTRYTYGGAGNLATMIDANGNATCPASRFLATLGAG